MGFKEKVEEIGKKVGDTATNAYNTVADKSGKLINIEEPTEVQENKTEKIDKKTAKEEAKLKKEFEKDKQLDIYPTKISDDELPNGIQYWVNKNYPDYIFKNIENP